MGKGTRSLLDNIRGLRHNSAILGLDHLNHNALLGLRDSFTVAAARAVAATVATVRAVAATISAARAVAATVSATVATGITRVVAVAAACTFQGITAIARYWDRNMKQLDEDLLHFI